MLRQNWRKLAMLFCMPVFIAGNPSFTESAFAQAVATPVAPESVGKAVSSASTATARQLDWINSSIAQRVKLSEQLGEDGARAFATEKDWKPILEGTRKALAQGPDQVYHGGNGKIHVIEAKGGSGQLGRGYGYSQGSPEWAVESAKRVLRHPGTTAAEREAAGAILQAAANGSLEVHIVRTSHVLGEPTAAVLERTARCSGDATRLAKAAIADSASASDQVVCGTAKTADDLARTASASSKTALKVVAKAAVPIAAAVDVGLRVQEGMATERQFAAGMISAQDREVAHGKNVAGMVGGWGGAMAGAEVGAYGGAAAGTVVAPGPGTTVGALAGGVAGGVAGYVGGEAAAEWAVNKVHEAGTTIAETAGSVKKRVSSVWRYAWGE